MGIKRPRALLAGGLALGLALLPAQAALGAGSGSFGPTGQMGNARFAPAAAPLPDGRVLVAGGFSGSSFLSSAEVFNPQTNSFSSVGPMGQARFFPAAAPLPDGRVLVAGGSTGGSVLAVLSSAEVFSPQTNSFSSVGPMGTARSNAAAAPLPDGRVLVAGGIPGSSYLSSAEVFNPQTNTFSSAGIGAMGTARQGPAAAPLPDGRVLVAGGFSGSSYLSSAETFGLAKPSGALSFAVKSKSLVVNLEVPGTVNVSDALAKPGSTASMARKQKRKRTLLLKPSSASGGPGKITVPLALSGSAKKKLRRRGKVRLNAKIAFAPKGGECLAVFKQCYSSQFAGAQTAALQVKGKKRKRT
jgi:Kelch motif